MSGVKRDWDMLSEVERRHAVGEIIGYFEKERGETIGVVAAGRVLDVVLQATNGALWNRMLDSVMPLLEQKITDIDISLRK